MFCCAAIASSATIPSPEHLRVAHLARSLLHRRAGGHPALHVADSTALAIASAIVIALAVLVLPKKKQAASL